MSVKLRKEIEDLNTVGASVTISTDPKEKVHFNENSVRCAAHRVGRELGRKYSVSRMRGGVCVTFVDNAPDPQKQDVEQEKIRRTIVRQKYARKGIELPNLAEMKPEMSVKIDLSGCKNQYGDRDRTFRVIVSREAKRLGIKASCHKTGPEEFTVIRWK